MGTTEIFRRVLLAPLPASVFGPFLRDWFNGGSPLV
jgi:hypothetical protein